MSGQVLLVILGAITFAHAANCTLGTATGCSTIVAVGLTRQIAAELTAMGHKFKQLNGSLIKCTEPCVNQLQAAAADSLATVAKSKGQSIQLNSAFRSAAQQYLLYQWYLHGKCSISLAAKPGTSNHEGGRAIDVSAYNTWKADLTSHNWKWHGSSDVVHFDYQGAKDIAKQNLVAFQRLYNRKHPNKKIAEDGLYGPATAAALDSAPCNGF